MSPSVYSAISSIWSQNFNRMALSEGALRETRETQLEPVSRLDLPEKNMEPYGHSRMANSFLRLFLLFWIISVATPASSRENTGFLEATITPAAAGPQLVRTSFPLPRGLLHERETL